MAEAVGANRALLAFSGQVTAPTLGGLVMFKIGDIAFGLVALMALLSVVRHTRADEESGRRELLAATAVGRHAPLAAALAHTAGLCALTAALSAAGLLALGFGIDPVGAAAFGAAMLAAGLVFAAAAAVAAQLTAQTRTTYLLAGLLFGTAYILRFTADGGGVLWLRWLSPLGWSHLLRPFGDERWWTPAIPAAAVLVLAGTAFALAGRRDVGAGLVAARDGRATAAPSLRGPLGLAWRLQRGQLLGWTAAFAVAGAATASVAPGIPALGGLLGEPMLEFFRRYAAAPDVSLSDTYLWIVVLSLGYAVSLYTLLATLRLRSEEASGLAEPALSAPLTRLRWAGGHMAVTAAGTAAMLLAAGLGAGLVYGLGRGDVAEQLPRVLLAAAVQLPPALVVGSVAVFAFGFFPRYAVASAWVAWVFFQLFGESIGPVLGIDYWVANRVVPWHYVPMVLTGEEFSAVPLLWPAAVAAALTGAGLLALRRRDLV
ncbi:hypothetical protein [Allonocardiopsis opalescens]|uniref:ABC-2 type transport system permease protein n=1 Tax=Allonocardiopsis opalescens TaxID=1144618 RepID=A0A2T0Q7L8_9ACTN|nr:hypothetical protein [Allonocardiopsis opalescens]PRX99794.1 ABC-2 type transport system permease protein [Allonocardiopsis opalescens]